MRAKLRSGVDYFYCDQCDIHVAAVPIEPGVWEIQCPSCEGECGICDCQLRKRCFGAIEGPMLRLVSEVRVAKPH